MKCLCPAASKRVKIIVPTHPYKFDYPRKEFTEVGEQD